MARLFCIHNSPFCRVSRCIYGRHNTPDGSFFWKSNHFVYICSIPILINWCILYFILIKVSIWKSANYLDYQIFNCFF
jgi:hypothetical protein